MALLSYLANERVEKAELPITEEVRNLDEKGYGRLVRWVAIINRHTY